jgi:hypothetical protein
MPSVLRVLNATIQSSTMDSPSFAPRCLTRARSEKPSTVRTRDRELRRSALSAATLKITRKWRQRRLRAKRRLLQTDTYQRLLLKAPDLCQAYLHRMEMAADALKQAELKEIQSLVNSHTPTALGKIGIV